MLHRLSGQDLVNQNVIQQNSNVEKLNIKSNNPYSNIDKNLLIDETNISNEADYYERQIKEKEKLSYLLAEQIYLSYVKAFKSNKRGRTK